MARLPGKLYKAVRFTGRDQVNQILVSGIEPMPDGLTYCHADLQQALWLAGWSPDTDGLFFLTTIRTSKLDKHRWEPGEDHNPDLVKHPVWAFQGAIAPAAIVEYAFYGPRGQEQRSE